MPKKSRVGNFIGQVIVKGIVRHDGQHIPLPIEGWQEQTRWQAARCGYQKRCHRCPEGRDSTGQIGPSRCEENTSLTVTLTMQDQDGLVHFTWTVREAAPDGTSAGVPELDLVLFPGQSTFSRLHGRRMFLLKYEGQEHFFWYNLQPVSDFCVYPECALQSPAALT